MKRQNTSFTHINSVPIEQGIQLKELNISDLKKSSLAKSKTDKNEDSKDNFRL